MSTRVFLIIAPQAEHAKHLYRADVVLGAVEAAIGDSEAVARDLVQHHFQALGNVVLDMCSSRPVVAAQAACLGHSLRSAARLLQLLDSLQAVSKWDALGDQYNHVPGIYPAPIVRLVCWCLWYCNLWQSLNAPKGPVCKGTSYAWIGVDLSARFL